MTNELNISKSRALLLAVQGLVFTLILSFLSLNSLQLFGRNFSFSFLVLAGLYFWPRQASRSWSSVFVFAIGLLMDIGIDSIIGIRSLALLILFLALGRTHPPRHNLWQAGVEFFILLVFALLLFIFLGRLALGQWPYLPALLRDALIVILFFPFLYWLWDMVFASSEVHTKRERI